MTDQDKIVPPNAHGATRLSSSKSAVGTGHRKAFRWIALALSLLVALLVGEAAARVLHLAPDMRERWPGLKSLYQPDAEVGYVPRANTTTQIVDEAGQPITIHTDLHGARMDCTSPPRIDEPAVAIVGDSFTANLNTPDGQTLCASLSNLLGGRQVLNFGCLGYSNVQELALTRRWAPSYHIGTIVLAVCGCNDLTENLTWTQGTKQLNFDMTGPQSAHALARKSDLLTFLYRAYKSHETQPTFNGSYDLTHGLDEELLLYDAERTPQAAAQLQAAIAASTKAMEDFKTLADELNARPLVVFVPPKAMIYREILFATDSQIDPRAAKVLAYATTHGFDFDSIRGTWRSMADHAGLAFLDLTDEFRSHPEETLYGQIDRHWNAHGQQLAAQAIAQALGHGPTTTPIVGAQSQ